MGKGGMALQRVGGDREPPLQRLGHLRVRHQRRQIFRPQGEEAARQIVFLVDRSRHYPRPLPRTVVFDEADEAIRCIVA
jgi:hypothetical protein